MHDLTLLFGGGLLASLLMALVWLVQYRFGDAGIVDVAWGMGVALLAILFLWFGGVGPAERRTVAAMLISGWALRLSGYVALRLWKSPSEDGRYRELKANWGAAVQVKMFRFYQLQAFGCWLFALPLWFVGKNEAAWNLADYAAVAIWGLAILGEAMSDAQLAAFRRNPDNDGEVCRTGWWRFSRHPNYFFEWLHWWAYVLLAWQAPLGWITLLGPLAMGYFICFVTGIPPTEAQALRSRGKSYREYQRTTSAFFPWWPKQ